MLSAARFPLGSHAKTALPAELAAVRHVTEAFQSDAAELQAGCPGARNPADW